MKKSKQDKMKTIVIYNASVADLLLAKVGFRLNEVIPTPVPDVMPDAKMYHYIRCQGDRIKINGDNIVIQCDENDKKYHLVDEELIFDTQQGFINITNSWYSIEELKAMISKADELEI